jgi:hypothetical protein
MRTLLKSFADHLIEYMENTAGTDATWPHNLNMQANKFLQDKPSVHHEVKGDSVAKRASGAWGSRGAYLNHIWKMG